MNIYAKKETANDLWNIKGSFGEFNETVLEKDNTFSATNDRISVISAITKEDNGVFVRNTKIKNISNEEVKLTALSVKFTLDGGEYDVYSQYNGWQNESIGNWETLNTGIFLKSDSTRNAHSATPFVCLWNKQTGRGEAFHVVSYSAWEIKVRREFVVSELSQIVVEAGVISEDLSVKLMPGEEYELPQIILYEFMSRLDMDAWKLHTYINKKYPRKEMPVIYNSWLYKFDKFTYDDIVSQIEKAAELGVEYFVIDAGWFGVGQDWFKARGDWDENMTFGFCGRMKEVSDLVKEKGMKFGFWLEPECAHRDSKVVKEHPDCFIDGGESYFLDFANDDAVNLIFNKTCELLDRYGAKFLKFDFNADLRFDKTKTAFSGYFRGQKKYVEMLREKYPDLYINNCASGGMRMALRDGMIYDSFWPTDCQSPYHTMRMFKDAIKRMPPQWFDKWTTILSARELTKDYGEGYVDQIIATGDATWTDVSSVKKSYLEAFLKGCPVGLSCDLCSFTDEVFESIKKSVSELKKNREFWKNAVCHILADTESLLVLEFRSVDFKRIETIVYTKKIMQDNITVYPFVDNDIVYSVNDTTKTGREIFENGIDVALDKNNDAKVIILKAMEK